MRQTWFSRRAIGLHVVILVIVPTFAGLCLWQIRRALGGNDLSWAYVFEWPFFAGYAIYMWWRLLHEAAPAEMRRQPPGTGDASPGMSRRPGTGAADPHSPDPASLAGNVANSGASADPEEAERAAYNQYLYELAVRGRRKQWR
jgi:hypothetical protein